MAKRKAVFPLPGGYAGYFGTLHRILAYVGKASPPSRELDAWFATEFSAAENNARFSRNFLQRILVLEKRGGRIEVGPVGAALLESGDPRVVVRAMDDHVLFVREMLESLREPATETALLGRANEHPDLDWSTTAQILYRRGWLESAGLVEKGLQGQLILTEQGRRFLDSAEGSGDADRSLESRHVADLAPVSSTLAAEAAEAAEAVATADARAKTVVAELRDAAVDAQNSSRFELAVVAAFSLLGFQATTLGGPGKADGLLEAEAAPSDSYSVAIECKTSAAGTVQDGAIRWQEVQDHQRDLDARYSLLIGPAFSQAVRRRGADLGVAVAGVEDLVAVCIQHADLPLGLTAYRSLFAPGGVDEAVAEIGAKGEDARRWATIGRLSVDRVRALEVKVGPVSAREVLASIWTMPEEAIPEDVTLEEIEEVMTVLGSPLFGGLERRDERYVTMGSVQSSLIRICAVAAAISA